LNTLHRLRSGARHAYFGWWIVAGSIGIQILAAGLVMQAFGTYVAVWQAEFGWSKTAFAVAFALQRGMMAVLSPVQGWLLQRFGARRVIGTGLVILALGFVLLSRFETQLGFYLSFMVVALGVGLCGFLSLTTTVVNWFERRRSSALALMSVGVSVGGLLVPLVAWLMTSQGWRATSLMSAGAVLLFGLPLSALMRSTPEAYGLRPDGDPPPEPSGAPRDEAGHEADDGAAGTRPDPDGDFGAREALRTRAFWFITAGHALAVTLVATVTVHIVVHLNEGLGISIQTAATMVALMTGAQMVGQLLGGFLGDRFPKRTVAVIAMLAHAVALAVVAFAPSLAWVAFFAILHGFAWGARGPLMQAMRADYFGRASFPTIMGISFSFVMVGQMLGPLAAGALADAFGDYRAAFVGLAVLVASGSLFFVFAKPPRKSIGRRAGAS
jgi:MFS family permease